MSDLVFNTILLSIAPVVIFAVMAVVVWLRLRSREKLDKREAELRDQRTAAFLRQISDWANATVNFVIGVLLGVITNSMVHLILAGAWVSVFNTVGLAVALLFIVLLHDYLGKKFFPSGIRPARKPDRVRIKPLVRRLALPVGLVLGIVLASFGLDKQLFGWLFSFL